MRKIVFCLFFAGCSLAPRYEQPTLSLGEAFRTELLTQGAVEEGWWRQFGDEVLDQLVDKALCSNQELMVAIARVDQMQAKMGVVRSKLYPQVEADLMAQKQKVSTSVSALPPGIHPIFNLFGAVFRASYLVDLWGEVRSAVNAAENVYLASIEEKRMVVLGLVSSVASAYINLRTYDLEHKIAVKTASDRETSLKLANVRYLLGLTSKMPVEQAASEWQEALVQVENFRLLIAETENLLSALLGEASAPIPRGKTLGQLLLPPAIPAMLPSDLLTSRPDIQAAERKLIAANASIGVARAQFFPSISLTGALGVESVQLKNILKSPSQIFEYGSDIVQEIFTGGKLTSNLEMSYAVKEEALHQYLSTIIQALQEVNDSLIAHQVNLQVIELQKERVEALREYLKLSDLRYKEGQTDYLTYLDAERQFFRGELSLAAAVGEAFLSYIAIYESLGGSWIDSAGSDATLEYTTR